MEFINYENLKYLKYKGIIGKIAFIYKKQRVCYVTFYNPKLLSMLDTILELPLYMQSKILSKGNVSLDSSDTIFYSRLPRKLKKKLNKTYSEPYLKILNKMIGGSDKKSVEAFFKDSKILKNWFGKGNIYPDSKTKLKYDFKTQKFY